MSYASPHTTLSLEHTVMPRYFPLTIVCLIAITSIFCSRQAQGQSSSRRTNTRNSYQASGSQAKSAQGSARSGSGTTKAAKSGSGTSGSGGQNGASGNKAGQIQQGQVQQGMEGYCPVCLKDMKKWVRGNPAYQAVYDGHVYSFMSDAQKNAFLADPLRYVPVLGGDCVTCLAKMSQRMPGNIRHAAYHRGRLYLFAGKDQKQMFLKDAAMYANVDLALDGNCPVCQVEMQKNVPGNAEISTTLNGKRYLFPSAEQQKMFLSNPKKYVAP
jgi:YHS domain-containing protein